MLNADEPSWEKFIQEHPAFPDVYYKAWQMLPELILATTPSEQDTAGTVIFQLMTASISDFDDIMLLSCKNGHLLSIA